MFIQTDMDFNDLYEASWGEATTFLDKVSKFGYEDEFMEWLEECFSDYEETPWLTTINDFLWHDTMAENWLEELVGSDSPNDYYKIIDFCKAFYKDYKVIQAEDEDEVETFLNDNFDTISEAVEAMQDYSINDWEDFKVDYKIINTLGRLQS